MVDRGACLARRIALTRAATSGHPSSQVSDLNPQLAEFLVKACASDGTERFVTAADMRSALEAVRATL